MNVKKHSFAGSHNLEIIAIPPGERDVYCQSFQGVWAECKSLRASGIPTPFVLAYMTYKRQSGTRPENELIQSTGKVEYHVLLLGVCLTLRAVRSK